MVNKCTKRCLFIENIEHYIKQKDALNLNDLYFSTLKSGQGKFHPGAKRNLRSFGTNAVCSFISVVLSCQDEMENLFYHLVWLFRNVCHADKDVKTRL